MEIGNLSILATRILELITKLIRFHAEKEIKNDPVQAFIDKFNPAGKENSHPR